MLQSTIPDRELQSDMYDVLIFTSSVWKRVTRGVLSTKSFSQ